MSQSSRVATNNTKALSGTTFGSLDLRYSNFIITTTGAATATLPEGKNGQEVYILLSVDGGDLVLSANFQGSLVTATFADALDSLTLKWVSGQGWCTVSNQGTVVFA